VSSGIRTIVGLGAAVVIAACVDLSAPNDKPASISQVQLPAFFVVQGDTLRDTLGNPVRPSIIAYDGAGNALSSFPASFFIADSVPALHFNPDSTLSATQPGDTAGATAHIIGQIAGLSTAAQTIYVTVRPDTLERPANANTDTITFRISQSLDSAASIATRAVSTVIHGVGARPVPGVFVRYQLETDVASTSTSALAAYLRDDGNKVFPAGTSTPDTGDASGVTSRTLVLNGKFVAGTAPETVFVIATAMYRGVPLANSPLRIPVVVVPDFGIR
jgi:hypothetical protein